MAKLHPFSHWLNTAAADHLLAHHAYMPKWTGKKCYSATGNSQAYKCSMGLMTPPHKEVNHMPVQDIIVIGEAEE